MCRASVVHIPGQQGVSRGAQVKQGSGAEDAGRPDCLGALLLLCLLRIHQYPGGVFPAHCPCEQILNEKKTDVVTELSLLARLWLLSRLALKLTSLQRNRCSGKLRQCFIGSLGRSQM